MAECRRCAGSGRWNGRAGYTCFTCNGTGAARERMTRARRAAAAVSTGRLLQLDAMPTLAEVKAGAARLLADIDAAHARNAAVTGGQRLRDRRVFVGGAWRWRDAATDDRCLTGQFCPEHNLVDVPGSSAEVAAQAAASTPASTPVSGSPATRPYVAGRPRLYAELFPESATDADRAELAALGGGA